MTDTQNQIRDVCDSIKNLLLEKNKRYGDSALSPSRIFSKSDTTEQLCVRIDDKLSRISKGAGLLAADEDVIQDLIGYLVLLKISLARKETKKDAPVSKSEPWDGSDIEPDMKNWQEFWKTPIASINRGNSSKLNDSEWLDMYASGDKFG